ncbi:MAG: hypothetical protein EOM05_08130 [Clostridia bacterium]|nr:hypothetical protein [Clostridia bacterium]
MNLLIKFSGVSGVISGTNIAITLPAGTSVTSLTPVIVKSANSSINKTGAQDFTSPVTYTVTAEDGIATKTYTVNVTVLPSTDCTISQFKIGEVNGVISGTNISITLLSGTDVTSLTPVIVKSANSSINKTGAQNFTNPVTYTVTAEDGTTTKIYTVTITLSTPIVPPKTIEVVEAPKGIDNADKIVFEPIGGAFDESVEVRMKDDPATKKLIEDLIKADSKSGFKNATVFPLDISLYLKGTNTTVQPNDGAAVKITCPIPTSLLDNKDSIKVVYLADGNLNVLDTKIVKIDGVYCVEFVAKHFSPYAMVVSNTNVADKKVENPKTSDNSAIGISLIAIASLSSFEVVRRKRKYGIVK